MRRPLAWGTAVVAMVGACTSAPASPTIPETTTSTVAATTTSMRPPATHPDPLPNPEPAPPPKEAIYLTAVARGLEGSVYQGQPYEDPESFISTGLLFCDLLTAGLTIDEVLTAYVSVLAAESQDGSVAEEDLLLGGVVLGAAVRVLCPEFADTVEEGS